MPEENGISKTTRICKMVAAIFAGVVLVTGSGVGFHDYVTNVVASDLQKFEVQVVQTLQQFKQQIDVDYTARKYREVLDRYYHLRELQQKYPTDPQIQKDLERTEKELKYWRIKAEGK